MKSVLALFSILVLATLSSCVTDAGYRQLQATAETNPKPDAIVGLWHRKWKGGLGLYHQVSTLVRADGTGIDSTYVEDSWTSEKTESVKPLRWHYVGGGRWAISYHDHGLEYTAQYSGGKLIRYTDSWTSFGPLGRVSEIFERIPN